jgi:hypothetical protein
MTLAANDLFYFILSERNHQDVWPECMNCINRPRTVFPQNKYIISLALVHKCHIQSVAAFLMHTSIYFPTEERMYACVYFNLV